MKRFLIVLALFLLTYTVSSQNRQFVVDRCINKVQICGANGVICSNDARTKWFTLTPNLQLDGNRLSMTGFTVIRMDVGTSTQKDQLLFSFKDGSKLRLKSCKDIDVQNSVFFIVSEMEFLILKAKEIESVRYINRTDSSSFYYVMNGEDESFYYVNLFNNYYIRQVYCK